jgi:uncharacterized protein YabN with tetrapyrrole methylase and pyrophosphatase domain
MNENTNKPGKRGRLLCVGTGINMARQITEAAKRNIHNANAVFGVVPNTQVDQWLLQLNPNYVSFQSKYAEGKRRGDTYSDMVHTILGELRNGKDVCFVIYGHPGVYADVGHMAIKLARREGFQASMEPGVSAEDCLIADLGIDPTRYGCQSYETTKLLFYKHTLNPYTLLLLWQICMAGEHTTKTFKNSRENLQLTVEFLNQWYPLDHEVIVYEAPFMPGQAVRADKIPLSALPETKLTPASTLVVPPLKEPELDHETLAKFGLTEDDLPKY